MRWSYRTLEPMAFYTLSIYDADSGRTFESLEQILTALDLTFYVQACITEESGIAINGPLSDGEVSMIANRMVSLGRRWLKDNPTNDSLISVDIESGVYWYRESDDMTVLFPGGESAIYRNH